MLFTLKNNFHNTTANVKIAEGDPLSEGQIKRARNRLCGADGCVCGDDLGLRGPQECIAIYSYGGVRLYTK